MIHLTEQGFNAGRRLCGTSRDGGGEHVHAAYAPLGNAEYRAKVCPVCLETWALEAYDDGDEMPDYIAALRDKK